MATEAAVVGEPGDRRAVEEKEARETEVGDLAEAMATAGEEASAVATLAVAPAKPHVSRRTRR